ncbi:MAG TPA: alpha/beta fold hydrolase [Roseiflexaceae bacterium]|nr:alpha/beta fold hydrolase [Roseiflexaceae bacterium]
MTSYTIGQQEIFVQESGPSDAPLAVLIHGWSSSSFTWAPVLPILNRRYRCVAVDLPGFGQSPQPIKTPTIAWYADLIAGLIELLSPERSALVLGHSMGGQISATLAIRHPVLVEQLVLLNPALSGRLSTRVRLLLRPHVMAEKSRFMEWLLYTLAKTPLDYTDHLLKPSNFAERARLSDDDYRHIRADARRRGQGRTRAACYAAMTEGDLRGKLGQIDVPALVLWGAEDNVVPLRDAGLVAEEWPKADLRLIPNAGHWPQFEQTDVTVRHISHFLGLPPMIVGNAPRSNDLAYLRELAQFLNNTELGTGNLTEAQRLRLAALLHSHGYGPGEHIASMNSLGKEMYIVKGGQLEVWLAATPTGEPLHTPVLLATLTSGQVAGELSLLDGAPRSADLRAGPGGATLLTLTEEGLATLTEDDPKMGMRVMQNLAISLGRRMRNQNRRALRSELEARRGSETRVLTNTP